MIDTATVLVYAGGYLSIVFLSVCLGAYADAAAP